MLKFFAEKNVSSFCSAKATHIFSAKNIRILYIESAKTVNEMTLNELVKLMTLWTTGPRTLQWISLQNLKNCGEIFLEQFRKLINRYKGIGYSPDIMWQTACLVINPTTVDGYALLFNCRKVDPASESMMASLWSFKKWVRAWWYVFGLACHGSTTSFLWLFDSDSQWV